MSTIDTHFDAALLPDLAADATREIAVSLPAIEQYRALARRLDVLRANGGPKGLVVTSACPGEGRTTTALYAAIALGGRGHRVVLVDLDLRRPELASRHDLPNTPGFADVVEGRATLDAALRLLPGAPGVALLTAGETQSDPAPLLLGPRAQKLANALCASFDFVICDSPPALGVADAACIGDLVGGALLVARAGRTTRRDLGAAAASLAGVPIVGCVLTGVEVTASSETRRAELVAARRPVTLALAR